MDAPYRFSPPPDRPTNGLDSEKARSYRDGLRNQLRREESRDIGRSATGAERLRETRRELNRMDNFLNQPPAGRAVPPAVTPQLPGGNRGPLGDNGPVVRSGGHPQPTPAEIEEREKERAERGQQPRKAPPLAPVYDLYGERIQ